MTSLKENITHNSNSEFDIYKKLTEEEINRLKQLND